jgi:LacI family transcriptional regulator, fructose operon transcriptional repressor
MTRKKATIHDLAALAGVSASTVSAVLNGTWKERRIAAETAKRVERLAVLHKYTVNRQASGLRTGKSGLIGMLIPVHDNRFFSELAQVFERLARERHWYPIVVSTLRDPHLELETVNTLISYRIEYLVVTGATDPDSVSRACRHHGIAHVNVDLPGASAASVISDNYWGAEQLTKALIQRSRPLGSGKRNRAYFLGGIASDYATRRRIEGFSAVVKATFGTIDGEQIDACGYEADLAEIAIRRLYRRLGGLPRVLFVNSTIALEGVVRFLKAVSGSELDHCAIGCYDWDPFANSLVFPLLMVRQDVEGLLGEAFRIIDSGSLAHRRIVEIKPRLVWLHEKDRASAVERTLVPNE